MRLTSVVLRSSGYDDVELSLRPESRDRYVIRTIIGIDADELIPKFYGYGEQTSAKHYEQTMKPRNIIMRVETRPQYQINENVSDIRDRIYRLISANRSGIIQVMFKAGATTVSAINGRIIKLEVPYFSKVPELQITVKCDDPMFRSIHPIDYRPIDLPSSNPVILPDSASTAPHGLSFKIKFTAATSSFVIKDHPTDPEWSFTVTPPVSFAIDDEIHFSSEYSEKLVYLHNLTDPHHLMDMIQAGSTWPLIFPGNNELYFDPIANFDWLELSYNSAYWGV